MGGVGLAAIGGGGKEKGQSTFGEVQAETGRGGGNNGKKM